MPRQDRVSDLVEWTGLENCEMSSSQRQWIGNGGKDVGDTHTPCAIEMLILRPWISRRHAVCLMGAVHAVVVRGCDLTAGWS